MSRSRDGKQPRKQKNGGGTNRTDSGADGNGMNSNGSAHDATAPGMTGRYMVLLREDAMSAGVKSLSEITGLSVASTSDFDDGVMDGERLAGAEAAVFEKLGVAIVDMPPDQFQVVSAAIADDSAILAVEPERVVYALQAAPAPARSPSAEEAFAGADFTLPFAEPALTAAGLPLEFLRGYRDAVNHLVGKMLVAGGAGEAIIDEATIAAINETELTWGLQATKAAASRFSGKGIRVAVLDTGLDLGHPDFVGRHIVSKTFIQNQAVQDGHGHGTHCIGTACGPRQPGRLPRYGVAYNSEIYAGKVLSNQGSGADGGIMAGIDWAITNKCQIVSMSLGSPVMPGEAFSQVYESVARRALAAGTLIIAAAGNASNRPGTIRPVGHPANCPSIMAVGALDSALRVASFSDGGLNPQGGQVDIAGPGVQVLSAWPRPRLYHTISGTSMATPHVAGIAALLAEANPGVRGRALASLLMQTARRLMLPGRDVGAGLVQAP